MQEGPAQWPRLGRYEKLIKRKMVDMTVWCMVKLLCHELSARVLCMVYSKIIMSRVVSSCFV